MTLVYRPWRFVVVIVAGSVKLRYDLLNVGHQLVVINLLRFADVKVKMIRAPA